MFEPSHGIWSATLLWLARGIKTGTPATVVSVAQLDKTARTKLLSTSSMQVAHLLPIVTIALAAGKVAAICPGFNFGIGNVRSLGGGTNRCQNHFLIIPGRSLINYFDRGRL